MIARIVSKLALFALLAVPALAQSTTYTLAAANSGVWGGFLRAFGVQFEDASGNELLLNWIQVSPTSACAGVPSPDGFVFMTLPGQTELPCIPVDAGSGANHGTFAGVDANGIAFQAVYDLTISTHRGCSGGRGGGCHTVFTITAGTVTVTE